MHPRSRTPALHGQMSVRRQGSRIPWANNFPSRGGTPKPQDPETPSDHQIPPDEEGTSKIHRLRKLLQKLHYPIIREDCPIS